MRIDIIENKSCHITFDNGVTVSILIGYGSYSDNHGMEYFDEIGKEREQRIVSSGTAEIAAWEEGGRWITKELCPGANDNVLGWQDTAQILDFLNKAANYKALTVMEE